MEWKTVKLGDICNIFTGKKDVNQTSPDGEYVFFSCAPTTFRSSDYIHNGKAIIVAGNGSFTGRVSFYDGKFDLYQRTYACTPNREDFCVQYAYWYMKHFFELKYRGGTRGSSIPYIVKGDLANFEISFPNISAQRRIAAILSSLDAQIENNNRINRNLEEQAQALFKSWFVDFEPWGGKMPEDWKEGSIYDVAEVLDKYRKPLSNNVREKMKKTYPYYGATSLMDYVDNYLFDGIYTLLGEDGSVIREDGTPYVQYVWGKMWVNNHAHVLQGKNGYSTELLHVMLSRLNIKALVTGAVQAKLSQGNMQKIGLVIPADNILSQFCETIGALYSQIRNNHEQSSRLAQLRDTLLPKLMKGEIDINK